MTKRSVDIKAGWLFPFPFLILGAIFLVAGLVVITDHAIGGSVLILVGIFILTAYEGTQINAASKTLREYYCFIFIKMGKPKKYRLLEGIAIHTAKMSQKMFTARTLSSSTITYKQYNAYLKFDGGEKMFLFSNKDKMKLMHKANEIARSLDISVADFAVAR